MAELRFPLGHVAPRHEPHALQLPHLLAHGDGPFPGALHPAVETILLRRVRARLQRHRFVLVHRELEQWDIPQHPRDDRPLPLRLPFRRAVLPRRGLRFLRTRHRDELPTADDVPPGALRAGQAVLVEQPVGVLADVLVQAGECVPGSGTLRGVRGLHWGDIKTV